MSIKLINFFRWSKHSRPLAACFTLACLAFGWSTVAADDGLTYRTSWLGNTFGRGYQQWVQINATALYVAPDGTCYTNSKWDEGHHAAGIYRDGKVLGTLADMPVSGGVGGWAVTGDDEFIYASVNPWEGGQFVRRFLPDGSRSAWQDEKGGRQDQIVVTPTKDALVSGLAVDRAAHRLYVSVKGDDLVKFYDTRHLAAAPSSFPLPRPGRSVVAPDGTLWIIQEGDDKNAPRVLHLTGEGKMLPEQIRVPGWSPTALVFDGHGRLFIADNGPDQNVKIYADLHAPSPQPASTFGQSNFSGTPGQVTAEKWGSSGLVGIGLDAKDNLYAILNGADIYHAWDHGMGLVMEARTPAGALNWRLLGLGFVDSADVDTTTVRGDTLDVFTKTARYTLDLAKTGPGTEWTYAGHTANPFKYPADERWTKINDNFLHLAAPWVRNFAGGKFLFVTDMPSAALRVYRFNRATDGETAIPCAVFTNDALWLDANGDGTPQESEYTKGPGLPGAGVYFSFWVDAKGDVWQSYVGSGKTGLRRFALQGLDAHGTPRWEYAHAQLTEQPAPFEEVYRVVYLADTDTMYLSGYARSIDPAHHWGGPGYGSKWLGSVVARYDHWSQGGATKPRWTKVLPDYDPGPIALSVAGDFLFVGYAHFGDNANSGRVRVFRAADGVDIGSLHAGPEVNSVEGTMDVPYALNAFRRASGEYLVFSEEDFFAKVLMYRWTPSAAVPAAPEVRAEGGNTVARVTWRASAGASRYILRRAPQAAGPYTTVTETGDTAFTDTGLDNQTTYLYSVQAIGAAGDSAPSLPVKAATSARLPLRINVGGDAAGDFLADIYGRGGNTIHLDLPFKTDGVNAPAPPEVYASVRRQNSVYTIPGQTPGAPLTVRLHFGEWWFDPGKRIVNVTINGKVVLADFDPAGAAAGKGRAVVREIAVTPDAGGRVVIEATSPGEAMLSGIEILPAQIR